MILVRFFGKISWSKTKGMVQRIYDQITFYSRKTGTWSKIFAETLIKSSQEPPRTIIEAQHIKKFGKIIDEISFHEQKWVVILSLSFGNMIRNK